MKPEISLRVSQQLSLTPQLQQAIKLLQLSALELEQEVGQMLETNPFLEVDSEESQATSPDPVQEQDRDQAEGARLDEPVSGDGYEGTATGSEPAEQDSFETTEDWLDDWSAELVPSSVEDWGSEGSGSDGVGQRTSSADSDLGDRADTGTQEVSLTEHLHQQALGLRLSPEDRAALYFLIESLNEDGYLTDSLEDLVMSLQGGSGHEQEDEQKEEEKQELLHHFTVALGLLQHMHPIGVGARHLVECLQLQLRHVSGEDASTVALALRLCQESMEDLARRNYKRLSAQCGASEEAVREAAMLLAQLEPKPGRPFVSVQKNEMIPDVLVTPVRQGGRLNFQVRLNEQTLPRLRVNEIYANALRGNKNGSTGVLQQHLQEARWFIKSMQQRHDTLLRVSQAIVQRQKGFLTHGSVAMRPLVLREIAQELEMHESTVSRVTTSKYMATPQGTVELKFFFGSSLETETGGSTSSTAVRAVIEKLIESEDRRKPLSDSRIADLLKEQGIACARRTVAKYRDTLNIPTADLRRQF